MRSTASLHLCGTAKINLPPRNRDVLLESYAVIHVTLSRTLMPTPIRPDARGCKLHKLHRSLLHHLQFLHSPIRYSESAPVLLLSASHLANSVLEPYVYTEKGCIPRCFLWKPSYVASRVLLVFQDFSVNSFQCSPRGVNIRFGP